VAIQLFPQTLNKEGYEQKNSNDSSDADHPRSNHVVSLHQNYPSIKGHYLLANILAHGPIRNFLSSMVGFSRAARRDLHWLSFPPLSTTVFSLLENLVLALAFS
jgi:hypothetical protein